MFRACPIPDPLPATPGCAWQLPGADSGDKTRDRRRSLGVPVMDRRASIRRNTTEGPPGPSASHRTADSRLRLIDADGGAVAVAIRIMVGRVRIIWRVAIDPARVGDTCDREYR